MSPDFYRDNVVSHQIEEVHPLVIDDTLPHEIQLLLEERKKLEPSANGITLDQFFDFIIERKEEGITNARQIRDIVPIHEWVRSDYFLGDESKTLYKYWEDVVIEFCESNKNELIITGSLRSGKSTCADILAIRKLYELSCFSPIPAYFHLSTSSLILFMYLSLSLTQAMMLGLGKIRRMIDKVPYFLENFQRDKRVESYLKFVDPSVIFWGGSELGHFKGSDLYLLIFDEANFAKGGLDQKFGNAVDIYREATIRRKSTFMAGGIEHGLGIIISSADTQSSFVEKHIEEVRGDPGVMIVESVAYEVQPERYRGQKRFWVFIGDEILDPFIPSEDIESLKSYCANNNVLFDDLDDFDPSTLSENKHRNFRSVPVSFKNIFKKDIYGALREICGIPVGQTGRFFTNRVMYTTCFPREKEAMHPDIRPGHPFKQDNIVVSYLDEGELKHYFSDWKKFNSNYEYFVGLDQSLSSDITGLALSHIDPENEDFECIFDFMLRILPPRKPGKISPEKIANFIIWLKKEKGIKNLKVRQDWYASSTSNQSFHLAGIDADINHIDKDWVDYRNLAGSILDGNIKAYHHGVFRDELFALVQDNDRKKIDHASGGSKDVADAVCQSHSAALDTFLEIRGGLRFFNNFTVLCLDTFKPKPCQKLAIGIYFGPEAFYAIWCYAEDEVKLNKTRTILRVIGEYADHSSTSEVRAFQIKNKTIQYAIGRSIVYAGDPEGKLKRDVSAASPVKEYRRLGVPIRTRNIDRENFDVIQNLLRNKNDPQLIVNEMECPRLIRALRKAKYKVTNGVRVSKIDFTGEEYPVYALCFAAHEALSKTSITAY